MFPYLLDDCYIIYGLCTIAMFVQSFNHMQICIMCVSYVCVMFLFYIALEDQRCSVFQVCLHGKYICDYVCLIIKYLHVPNSLRVQKSL